MYWCYKTMFMHKQKLSFIFHNKKLILHKLYLKVADLNIQTKDKKQISFFYIKTYNTIVKFIKKT